MDLDVERRPIGPRPQHVAHTYPVERSSSAEEEDEEEEEEDIPTTASGSRSGSATGLAQSTSASTTPNDAAPNTTAAAAAEDDDDDDDERICRVCRAEDEPDNPLYHPCKCSGSIRYVHSDCLVQWLQQSKNKKCELCGYPFSFRKIYPADMPSRLPTPALIRTLASDLTWLTLTSLRAILVACSWLILLPLVAYGMWRTLFVGGSSFAWWLMDPQKGIVAVVSNGAASKGGAGRAIKMGLEYVADSGTTALVNGSSTAEVAGAMATTDGNMTTLAESAAALLSNATATQANGTTTGAGRLAWAFVGGLLFPFPLPESWPMLIDWSNLMQSDLPETIFRGQILTVCVVLGFLAVFLLREWIFQNGLGADGGAAGGGNRVEVPVDGPRPGPEEFAPEVMAVRWRRRRAEGRDRDREGGGVGGGARDALGRRRRARRRPAVVRFGADDAAIIDAGAGDDAAAPAAPPARQALLPPPVLPFLNDPAPVLRQPENDRDHQDEYESVEGSPRIGPGLHYAPGIGMVDFRLEGQPGSDDDDANDDDNDDAEVFADEPDPVAMREARNRYFAIRDHNHDFGTQAELNPSGGNAEAGPSSRPAATPRVVEPEDEPSAGSSSAPPRRSARLKAKLEDADRDKPASDVPHDVAGGPDDGWEDMPEPSTNEAGSANEPPEQPGADDRPRLRRIDPANVQGLEELDGRERNPLADEHGHPLRIDPDDFVRLAELDRRRRDLLARGVELRNQLEDRDRRRRALEIENRALQQQIARLGPPGDRDDFDDVDEGEEGEEGGFFLEGDLDGVLEAIGMRGPLINLIQNVFIILFVLGVCLTVLVQVPYVIGKMHLLADWNFLVNIVTLPIRLVRFVSDPIIDIILDFARLLVIQPLRTRVPAVDSYLNRISAKTASSVNPGKYSSIFGKMLSEGKQSSIQSLRSIPYQVVNSFVPHIESIDKDASIGRKALYYAGEGFAALGAFTAANWQMQERWLDSLTEVDTTLHRIVIIGIGYFDVAVFLFLVATLGEERLGSTGKTIAQAVQQYGTVVKLGFFMAIELFVFPLIMGYFLDLFSLPLFVEGTLAGRIQAQQTYPILSTFGHWLGGTLFMFSFAKFLSTCRSICRKGAMYIIRDPQDPSFSPVRDILDKRTSVQLYKLIVSACMYLSVLSGPIGGLLFVVRYVRGFGDVLPLRLHMKTPASTNPFDIVLLLFVVRQGLALAFPTDHFRRALKLWWKLLARTLRLSSYFDGVRHEEEEQPGRVESALLSLAAKVNTVFRTLLLRPKRAVEQGGFMRVPYADQVVLIRPRKAVFVAVDPSGVPVDEEGKITAILQTRVATKAGRNARQDYCMVHLPPFYRARFWIFAVTLWTGVAWACVGSMLAILVLGRWMTGLWFKGPVHDGYSLILGAHVASLVWYLAIEVAYRHYRHRRRGTVSSKSMRSRLLGACLRLSDLRTLTYIAASLPVGIAFELYIAFPFKYGFSTMTPVMHVQEAWVTGIGILALCMYRRNVRVFISAFVPDVKLPTVGGRLAIVDRILPVAISLTVPIFGPAAFASVFCLIGRLSQAQSAIVYRWVYPAVLTVLIGLRALQQFSARFREWSTRKLESRYLVEQRVMNLVESEGLGQDVKVLDPTRHANEGDRGVVAGGA